MIEKSCVTDSIGGRDRLRRWFSAILIGAADLGVNLNTIATAYRELQNDGLIAVKHGSGAVVASNTASERSEDELRRPLRTALTQLILAGLPKGKILGIVSDELRGLMKGAK